MRAVLKYQQWIWFWLSMSRLWIKALSWTNQLIRKIFDNNILSNIFNFFPAKLKIFKIKIIKKKLTLSKKILLCKKMFFILLHKFNA